MAEAPPGRSEEGGSLRHLAQIRRILVALDTSPDSLAGLDVAAELAAGLRAELAGIFVEDELLLRAGRLPLTREINQRSGEARELSEETVERQLRAQAGRARQALQAAAERTGATWRFRTARGRVAGVLSEAAEEADLLTLGITGRSPLPGPGSTVRALLEAATHDLLVLRRGMPLGRTVLAVHDGSDAGRAAVRKGAGLARREGSRLEVLLIPADAEDAAHLREEATVVTRELGVRPTFRHLPGGGVTVLAAAVAGSGGGLLVTPARPYREELDELLRSTGCPVVLVN